MVITDYLSAAISYLLRKAGRGHASPASGTSNDTRQMGETTVEYVESLASDSFKRQVDLDESVWRSLPFIAATFAFVAAVVGRAAQDVPDFQFGFYEVVTRLLLVAAVFSLAWTLRWFFVVLKPREYEYPADDASVRQFAEEMTNYYAELNLAGDDLDKKVVEELRLFMVDQYGSAARTNLRLNAVRLQARGKVLLFILIGFVLAFSCEAAIFLHRDFHGSKEVRGVEEREERADRKRRDIQAEQGVAVDNGYGARRGPPLSEQRSVYAYPAKTAKVAARDGRREHLGPALQRQHTGEAVMTKGTRPKPESNVTPLARPTPPPSQFVAKLRDGAKEQGSTPPPTSAPRRSSTD